MGKYKYEEVRDLKNHEIKLDAEPKNPYEKAKKALYKAEEAFRELSPQEQQMLIQDYLGAEAVCMIYNIMKQYRI